MFQSDLNQASPVYKSESLPPAQFFILCETAGDDNGSCEDGNELMGSVREEEEEEDTPSKYYVPKKELVDFGLFVCLLVGWLVDWVYGWFVGWLIS
jgi:hypothetical protein